MNKNKVTYTPENGTETIHIENAPDFIKTAKNVTGHNENDSVTS